MTTPSRARSRVVVVGLIAGAILIQLLTDSVVPLLVWAAVIFGVVLLMLQEGTGGVTNTVSILAGRPIALTARGRERVSVDHITAEKRREMRLGLVVVLGIVVVAAVLAIVND